MKSLIQYLSLTSAFASSTLATSSIPSAQALIYPIDVKDGSSDSRAESSGLTEISAMAAQLIVDRRLDINRAGEIRDVADDVLESVGKYGGNQRPMFDSYQPKQPLRVGVILGGWDFDDLKEDYKKLDFSAPSLGVQDFDAGTIWDAVNVKEEYGCSYAKQTPSGLRMDAELTGCGFTKGCMKPGEVEQVGQTDEDLIEKDLNWIPNLICRNGHAIVRLSFPENSNDRIVKAFNKIQTILSTNAKDGERESTILILPPQSLSSLDRRQIPQEEPLTAFNAKSSSSSASKQPTSTTSSTLDSPSNTTALPSDLAISRCFTSLSACNAGTNNCSSHGTCIQFHAATTGDDPNDKGCWTCSCKTTPNGRGGVISWGGKACQKKDISVQFWLFAGFGVTMLALVGGGIGMLYSMGSEPLPSVLGAGVGGPRASR